MNLRRKSPDLGEARGVWEGVRIKIEHHRMICLQREGKNTEPEMYRKEGIKKQ